MEGIETRIYKIPKEDLERLRANQKRRDQRQQKRKANSHRSYSSRGGSKHGFNYYADQTMDLGPSPEQENGNR